MREMKQENTSNKVKNVSYNIFYIEFIYFHLVDINKIYMEVVVKWAKYKWESI